MKKYSSLVLKIVNIIFWVVFIGLCIKTGALLFNFANSLFNNPLNVHNLYEQLDLSSVYSLGLMPYILTMSTYIQLFAIKAFIIYLIIKILGGLNPEAPFNSKNEQRLWQITKASLALAIFSLVGSGIKKWVISQGQSMPIEWSTGEYLFFAAIIFIIHLVFKKGTDLQTENDLTV